MYIIIIYYENFVNILRTTSYFYLKMLFIFSKLLQIQFHITNTHPDSVYVLFLARPVTKSQ